MGKFFSALVTDKNEILFFNKEQRDLIKQKKLKDRFGNYIFDADSHSSICAYNFANPYDEDACNKIEYDPFKNKIDCKTLVFPLNNELITNKIINEIKVFSLVKDVNFSVKPFSFKNYNKLEIEDFLNKNKTLIQKTLNYFKQIENNVSGFYNVTRLNKVWDDKIFELVHDDILVPSTKVLEREFMTDDLKKNNAFSYSLRNYLMLGIMTRCFNKKMLDNNEKELNTDDFQFFAKNSFVIACDGTNYGLYANVDGKVTCIYKLG